MQKKQIKADGITEYAVQYSGWRIRANLGERGLTRAVILDTDAKYRAQGLGMSNGFMVTREHGIKCKDVLTDEIFHLQAAISVAGTWADHAAVLKQDEERLAEAEAVRRERLRLTSIAQQDIVAMLGDPELEDRPTIAILSVCSMTPVEVRDLMRRAIEVA